MRFRVIASVSLTLLVLSKGASSEPVRLHATAGGARAVTGHQVDELGFGVGASLGAELPLTAAVGLQLDVNGLFLADGDPPKDPTFADQGGATALGASVGLHLRPFAAGYEGGATTPAGIWLQGSGGVVGTGGGARGMLDAKAGYDFLIRDGAFGVGPMLGFVHVFQPDDELRPADANIVLFGVHARTGVATEKALPSDRDGDGILDTADDCPDDPEDDDDFEDDDGCPELDNDEDGILDAADHCPSTPEDPDGFEDDDGCPEEDNDGDGIPDAEDRCPDDAEDMDAFEDEDGCPDEDNDGDGIADIDDLCPNEPETENGYADHDGCPDSEQIRVLGDKIVLDDRVHFRTNSAVIRPVSHPLLERLAKLIDEHPEYVHIDVEGHTDARGPEWFNKELSQDRAQSVLDFLVSRGIARDRLTAKGYGSDVPLVDERSEHAYFLNRRVEFTITREVKKVIRENDTAPGDGDGAGESDQ